jgi:hypothetical protein
MPEGTSNSIISLGELSKPADTLIKKVSKAVGGIFEPYQIKRIAKAEAEAMVIKAQGEIQITDLHRRAMHRFVEEEAQRQKNIEDITAKALPQLSAGAKPDAVADDWITNFFDKSRIVSDAQMQDLWSRVLAGEANAPGSFSKRTVNFLSDLDKVDAKIFSDLCGFVWVIGPYFPLVFDAHAEIYNRNGVTFDSLTHLDNIGLIKFDNLAGFARRGLPKKFPAYYYGRPLLLEMPEDTENQIEVGKALMTQTGSELAPICGSKPVAGFWEYVCDTWKQHLPEMVAQQNVPPNDGATRPG